MSNILIVVWERMNEAVDQPDYPAGAEGALNDLAGGHCGNKAFLAAEYFPALGQAEKHFSGGDEAAAEQAIDRAWLENIQAAAKGVRHA